MSRVSAATAALALGPGSGHTSLGPYCACSSCLFINLSSTESIAADSGCAAGAECGAATDPACAGPSISADHKRSESVRGSSADPLLVAAEEARSCADGQHAQVAARADAAGARPRPALGGWRNPQFFGNARLHGMFRCLEDSMGS